MEMTYENFEKDTLNYNQENLNKIKEDIEWTYEELNNSLKTLLIKADELDKSSKYVDYESFSSFENSWNEIVVRTKDILAKIFAANIDTDVDIKINRIIELSLNINQNDKRFNSNEETKFNEETKYSEEFKYCEEDYSIENSELIEDFNILNNIYGKEFEVWKIPIHTKDKIINLENQIKSLANDINALCKVNFL